MYLLVRPDGARYWRMDSRFDGKRRNLAMGVYPEVTLAEARKRRKAAKALLAEGHDPGAIKRAVKAGAKPLPGKVGQVLADAFTVMGEGMWDWDLKSGQVSHNARWAQLMGLDEQQSTHGWQETIDRLYEGDRKTGTQ